MKESILIVDDDRNTRKNMASALSHIYKVYTASNGIDAMHLLDENKDIHIVLTDFLMPGMNGIELLQQIHFKDKKTLVIMITGFSDVDLRTEAKNLGAYCYLNKPIDLSILEVSIKKALEEMNHSP